MARNITLSLGLVNIPVKVDKAADDKTGPELHTVCDDGHDPARIKSVYRCPICGNEEYQTLKKAHPTEDGKYIVAEQEEVKKAGTVDPAIKSTMSLSAHPLESVLDSTLATGKVYNLLPGKGVLPDMYATIVEAVRQAAEDGTALTTVWAYTSKPTMYVLQARKDILTAHQLAWPDQVRATTAVEGTADSTMVQQFLSLMSMSASAFDPDDYRDNRAASIEQFLASKAAVDSGDPDTTPAALPAGGSNVADQLAAALAAVEASGTPDFSQMKKDELVEEAKANGLPVSGTKAELIERLKEAVAA